MNRGILFWAGWLLGLGMTLGAVQAATDDQSVAFQFREPQPRVYQVVRPLAAGIQPAAAAASLRVLPSQGIGNVVELGNRIVLRLAPDTSLRTLLANSEARLSRVVASDLYILLAPDAWTAAEEAQRLAQLPGVLASYPVMRRRAIHHAAYAPKPNDPYYPHQWNFENRGIDGSRLGLDINLRSAWPIIQGEGIIVGIGDEGVDLTHPDLAAQSANELQYDFAQGITNGSPINEFAYHGTAVAGLIAAAANNAIGMVGIAPRAKLASWVVFDTNGVLVSDENMMDMFQRYADVVEVQNHSWGNGGLTQAAVDLLQKTGISNAVQRGRGGKGVVIVRSAGNGRVSQGSLVGNMDANDDGYLADPQVIGVAAVRSNGRVASYSTPGACLLVGSPSSDWNQGFPTIFTADIVGTNGLNQINFTNDLADYCFDALGFTGTSAAAPQIAGIAALVLSANTNLTYRDVQHILIQSARQTDPADPDTVTNGAGLAVNHNVGFGVPDAGVAVRLARNWPNRPPATNLVFEAHEARDIPDLGMRLLLSGESVPAALSNIVSVPGLGPHADEPTAVVPLIDVGSATAPIAVDLHGKAALIRRGGGLFSLKINYAAQAGAVFAVIYNNTGHTNLQHMSETDFTTIPAVFINQDDGEAVRDFLATQTNALAQLRLFTTNYTFSVTNSLCLEHVGVRVDANHPARGQIRVTLLSPSGTRSVMQHFNFDLSPGPENWTYFSTHHFYESSAGTWTIAISDEMTGTNGVVNSVGLLLEGVPITDEDHDGLDDQWEESWFHTLAYGPRDDPDRDGYSNAREQVMGTDPTASDVSINQSLDRWNADLLRLSWPATARHTYSIGQRPHLASPWQWLTNVPGAFPEAEWFLSPTNSPAGFFLIRQNPE